MEPESEDEPEVTCKVTKWYRHCTTSTDRRRRRLKDEDGDEDYWKLQNSWGASWGDGGFIKVAIRAGIGVCGMNSYLQYVDWEDDMYNL